MMSEQRLRCTAILWAAVAAGLTLASAPAFAQQVEPLRIGLALSGGSAKGFAHIGVLRVLEEAGLPIHTIVGTSMGSIVGGLYALGYGPDELERVALDQDWLGLFNDRPTRLVLDPEGRAVSEHELLSFPIEEGQLGLPSGLVSGQKISNLLTRLTWAGHRVQDFADLPIPFAAVATDLETGEAVVLRRGSLAQALQASMSLPAIFQPTSIQGRLLVDGGLARNLPAEDAAALGADFVVCSDVSDPLADATKLRSLIDILLQTTTFQMNASTEAQRQLCDLLIRPDLGGLSAIGFDQAEAWIARGDRAARMAMAELEALAMRAAPALARPSDEADLGPEFVPEAVDVSTTRFVGVSADAERMARTAGTFPEGEVVPFLAVERAVQRAYDTGLFNRLSWRLAGASGDELIVEGREAASGQVGFGFRYDSHYKAAVALSANRSHWIRYGSTTRLDLRLGEQLHLGVQHLNRTATASRFLVGVDANYDRTPLDVYAGGDRIAEVRAQVFGLSGFVGTRIGNATIARVRVKGEHLVATTITGETESDDTSGYFTLGASLWHDTRDRPDFPTRGVSVFLESEWADDGIGSGATFRQHLADVQAAVPVGRRLTVRARAVIGASSGPDLPLHYRFFLGGWNTSALFPHRQHVFYGLEAQELSGRAVQLGRLGVQVEVAEGIFGTVWANAGAVADRWAMDLGVYERGYAISLGTVTVVGPLEITVAGRSPKRLSGVEVNLGYRF